MTRDTALRIAIEVLKAKPDIFPEVNSGSSFGLEAAKRLINFTEELRLYLEEDDQ